MEIKRLTAISLVLLLSACGGGGGGSDDDDNTNITNEPSDTSDTSEDNPTVTPSNTDSSIDGLNQFERKFATTFNSEDDFTVWGCSVEISGEPYAIILSLEESMTATMAFIDSADDIALSVDDGEWAANENNMGVLDLEEELLYRFNNYQFSDAFSWDATIPLADGSEAGTKCRLFDQDLNLV